MQDLTASIPMAPHPDDFVHQAAPTILETFPAGAPRGSWPAEEFATARRNEGINATVVMNLAADSFLVIAKGGDA
jgi:hypothetical protein